MNIITSHKVQNLPKSLRAYAFHFAYARTHREKKKKVKQKQPYYPVPQNQAMVRTSLQKQIEGNCRVPVFWLLLCYTLVNTWYILCLKSTDVTYMRSGLKRWIIAHNARPLFQEVVRSVMLTLRYPSVCFWHQVKSLLGRMSDSAVSKEQIFRSFFVCSESFNISIQAWDTTYHVLRDSLIF